MDTEKLSVEVHREFARRIEEHNDLQDRQIAELQRNVQEIQTLTVSVEKMAIGIESMAKELGRQSENIGKLDVRLDAIEREPGEKWKKAIWIIVSGIIGFALALVAAKIGAVV